MSQTATLAVVGVTRGMWWGSEGSHAGPAPAQSPRSVTHRGEGTEPVTTLSSSGSLVPQAVAEGGQAPVGPLGRHSPTC